MQHIVVRVRIPEADMLKFHFTLHGSIRAGKCTVLQAGRCVQNLIDTFGRNGGTGQDDQNDHEHHKGHDDLHGILGKDDHIREDRQLIHKSRIFDQIRANPVYRQRQTIHHKLDARHQKCHRPAGKKLCSRQSLVGVLKLFLLIAFRIVGTDDI